MASSMSSNRPWFERAFGKEYLELYAHRSPQEGELEVQALLKSGLLGATSPLLDLCCGSGRHLKAMRKAGLKAWGLDLSAELLRAGKLHGIAARGDMRRLPFVSSGFACVTSLFTSFGYFDTDAANLEALIEIRRVLAPDGVLLLDHMNPKPTLASLKPVTHETRGESTIVATRRYDQRSHRLVKEIEMTRNGVTSRWHESVRLYAPDEFDALLAVAGLHLTRRYSDFSGGAFDADASPRQLLLACKT